MTPQSHHNTHKRIPNIQNNKKEIHTYPRNITYVGELPKTPSGKIQRFVLREQRKNEILRVQSNG